MIRSLLLALLLFSCASLQAANLVFMIGEDEYHTWETLPEFAKADLSDHKVTIIHADAVDKNDFPGLIEALRDADLLLISVRRRTPHKEQLDAIRAFLAAGKPLVGIRTASHAFALRPKDTLTDPTLAAWQQFDPEVLGGHYTNHYEVGPKTTVSVAPPNHPILDGIQVSELIGNGSLYKCAPLAPDATPILFGTIPNQAPEPLAWTHTFGPKHAPVFYTSLGHPEDFKELQFRHLLRNALSWALRR